MPFRRPLTRRQGKASTTKRGQVSAVSSWVRGKPFVLRWLLRVVGFGVLLVIVGIVVFELWFGTQARQFDLTDLNRMPERSVVLDRAGGELGKLHGENRLPVAADKISPYFKDALLAREDDRFYRHGGVDFRGVARSLVRNFQDKGRSQGASTLTMQLARNAFKLGRQKTYGRKFLEIAVAQRIESKYTKDEILTYYCNQVYLGQSIHGIEAGAQAYFRKSAAELTLGEAAMLAGIIRGPNSLSPWKDSKLANSARDTVLDRMVATGRLDAAQAAAAKKQPTRIPPAVKKAKQETWALDAVKRGLEHVLDHEDIEEGGLKIYTTLHSGLQRQAEAALDRRLTAVESAGNYPHQTKASFHQRWAAGKVAENASPDYVQGGIVLLENATGAVLAVVGGRDYRHSSYNRALLAKRQAGSTFKPLVYAAAVQKGLFPGMLINDNPLEPHELRPGDERFSPENSDGSFAGMQTAAFGLAKSRNTMAVRVGEFAGVENVRELATQAGLGEIESTSAQLFLGNVGVGLEAMTSAMSIFANAGNRCRPFLIDRIENADGEIVFRSGKMEYNVVPEGAAWEVNQMMQQVMAPGGTADRIADFNLTGPLCGKTGTTDGYKDAWFVGSSPELSCGVWVGLDDNSRIVGQGYASRLALPVWGDVMRQAEDAGFRKESRTFRVPPLQEARLCQHTGKLARSGCRSVVAKIPHDCLPSTWCKAHNGQALPELQPSQESPKGKSSGKSVWDWLGGLFR